MTFEERFADTNLGRLFVAGAFLSPVVTQEKLDSTGSPLLNLAYYQAAAAQEEPDVLLAGTFLGLVAERELSENVVERVNQVLCVSLDDSQRSEVAAISEAQRRHSAASGQGAAKGQ